MESEVGRCRRLRGMQLILLCLGVSTAGCNLCGRAGRFCRDWSSSTSPDGVVRIGFDVPWMKRRASGRGVRFRRPFVSSQLPVVSCQLPAKEQP